MAPGLGDFEGDWRVVRDIQHADGLEAWFDGTASFVPDGAGLTYREEGGLVIAGQAPVRAERRYLWRARDDGRIAVLFDDGAAFHVFDPAADRPSDSHDCASDLYEVLYDFGGWPLWRARWCVTGPHKDYRMNSLYWRANA
ncbi:DUF6314 family protein [Roseovarius salis]|uniref:DUF6314 family protein n=1 Tax=Roseovarius salis TaxID=3376063 RepID=UPI0037C9359A